MSDNNAVAKAAPESGEFVFADGKAYSGFDLYTALENIASYVSRLRLSVEDLDDSSSEIYADLKNKTLEGSGRPVDHPCDWSLRQFSREVFIRSGILFIIICEIEKLLKQFDINPD